METQAIVTQIATLAPTVAAEHEAYKAATAAEREGEVALLQAVIETARPALRAITSRIKTSNCLGSEYYSLRGLYLDPGGSVGPSSDQRGNQTRGSYVGADCFLLTDGSILRLKYAGSWSQWQGEACSWESEDKIVPLESLTSREIHDAIRAIGAALKNQADGNKPKRTAASVERAAKIAAVTALLAK